MKATIKIKSSLCFVLSMLFLSGCNVTADDKSGNAAMPDHLKALTWTESADVEADVQKAIANKDYRLFAIAGRGERMPGVDAKQMSDLKQRCGVKYLEGSTDAIRDDEHMQLLQKAYQYAEGYNQSMVRHCR